MQLSKQAINLKGQKFHRLTVVKPIGLNKFQKMVWLCKCDCGNKVPVIAAQLRNGNTKSCSCIQKEKARERATKHGYARTHPLYNTWANIKSRCNNPKSQHYHNYGGRGISICESWNKSFTDFLADVGERPSDNHSIDRFPNMNGNYEPSNVRWATNAEQARNKRVNVWVKYKNETILLSEWAKKFETTVAAIWNMQKAGKSFEQITQFYENRIYKHHKYYKYYGFSFTKAGWGRHVGTTKMKFYTKIKQLGSVKKAIDYHLKLKKTK